MVAVSSTLRGHGIPARRLFLAFLFLCAPLAAVDAAVIASVDRGRIDLNESFTLKVMVDTAIDVEPDASALEQDFYVGSRSQLSNTSIVNGQITRSRTWSFVLMAKRAGNLEIPPIKIGNERSEPVPITVAPPSNAAPGEADIFVVTEADFTEGYVQAQILYTVKVYRAVATRQPRLSEPEIGGVDALVEVAGEERSYESILNGKSYNVVERLYALFPQESGTVEISPARFEARVLRNGRISGRKVFQSEPILIDVKPIPAPPDDYPDAAWLPAKSVVISEEWSREPDSLPAGEPITRRLTVTALGQLSTQIPVIDLAVSDSVKVYPDKPELRVNAESGGIMASRTDQYAMIGVRTGAVNMADLELPWWDIAEGAWKIARLPGRTIDILPSADALLPQVVPDAAIAVGDEGAPVVVHSEFWRYVAEVIGGIWVLTLLAWWWSGRPKQRREPVSDEPPVHKQQSRLLREARKAAMDDRSASVKAALLEWGRLEWPGNAPRSIGELADRVTEPTATELRGLCRGTYGPTADDGWRGDSLAKALRTIAVRAEVREASIVDVLPPLLPSR
jgi:hypothetical protein